MGMKTNKCDRCGKPTIRFQGSFFNTEECCPACIEKEQAHPMYQKAKEVERKAVIAGDYNFPGIGLPEDLYTDYNRKDKSCT